MLFSKNLIILDPTDPCSHAPALLLQFIKVMAAQIFKHDKEFLMWMDTNPSYFVVNARKGKSTNYFILHRSKCPHISRTQRADGGYTKRQYIKVGSGKISDIKNWFEKNHSEFAGEFSECKTCNPFESLRDKHQHY